MARGEPRQCPSSSQPRTPSLPRIRRVQFSLLVTGGMGRLLTVPGFPKESGRPHGRCDTHNMHTNKRGDEETRRVCLKGRLERRWGAGLSDLGDKYLNHHRNALPSTEEQEGAQE